MVQDQDYEIVDDTFEAFLTALIQELHVRENKDKVSSALFCLLLREANTWRSIRLLRKNTPVEFQEVFMVDVGTLLRAMFDAYLQATYIVHDRANRTERATQYLEFAHVERFKMPKKILSHDNPLSNRLKSSPLRPEGDKRLQQEFDRVKGQFLSDEKSNGKVRSKWYKGDLPHLAKAVGMEVEYDAFVASFSGCVHSSAFAVQNGPMVPPQHCQLIASKFAARVARLNVEHSQIYIGEDQDMLDELSKSWFDVDMETTDLR